MILLVCWEISLVKKVVDGETIQGTRTGDFYAEVDALNQPNLEAVRRGIRDQVCKQHQGANGISIGVPVFRSVTKLDEALIVRPR